MTTVVAARGVKGGEEKGGEGNAYRKGMFLAFIDDAFLQRSKVRTLSFYVQRDYAPVDSGDLRWIGGESYLVAGSQSHFISAVRGRLLSIEASECSR